MKYLIIVCVCLLFSQSVFANGAKDQSGCTSCGTNSAAAQNPTLYAPSSRPAYDPVTGEDTAESRSAAESQNISPTDNGVTNTTTSNIPSNTATSTAQPKKSLSNNDTSTENILGLASEDLRAGNVDMSTIPKIIVNVINVLLGIAGTVAIFSLIYHAVQMQINSGITGDSSGVDKAKKGMIGALIGFVIAILAWFLVTRAVELLSGAS